MNVEIIHMDKRVARLHYLDYRERVRKNREKRQAKVSREATEAGRALHKARMQKELIEKEDEELMVAYRALSREQRVLNVESVLGKAGVNKQFLPNLAIGRAHWKSCFFHGSRFSGVGSICSFSEDRSTWNSPKGIHGDTKKVINYQRDLFPAETWNESWRTQQKLSGYPVKAVVPLIPPQFRPDGNLDEYHLLWEPVWAPSPPVDPILLKKVSDKFYIVLAQWDLTPLERSVLEGRIR